jgi:hypothetical protein
MGRRKKYVNEEERKRADCEKARRYYERNREEVKRKNLEKYWEKREEMIELVVSGSVKK